MSRRKATYRARKAFKMGPSGAHYFRRYSATANADGARGGFTSHGFRVRVPILGPLTINLTKRVREIIAGEARQTFSEVMLTEERVFGCPGRD